MRLRIVLSVADYADTFVVRCFRRHVRTRFDYSDDRNVQICLHRIKCQRTRRVAGDDNRFHALRLQEMNNLLRKSDYIFLRFASVWHTRCIAEIDDPFIWQVAHDLPHNCQSSHAGIKDTDRGIGKV